MKKGLLIVFILFFFNHVFAQENCHLRISLLTCAPGEELYSTFGHTAIRVTDSTNNYDLVFNYGTFQFGPDFYSKFIRGKLLYFLSVEHFADFRYQYQEESRSIQEQTLQLSCEEKQKLFAALRNNSLEQNRYYKYDFLFDNCTTRARDIIKNNTGATIAFSNVLPERIPTFRNLIHIYLNAGHQYWSKLGIDLLLGAKMDRKVTNEEAMFLPDNLLAGFDHAQKNHQPLVAEKKTILQMPSPLQEGSFFRPFTIFTFLLLSIIVLSLLQRASVKRFLSFFDRLFFFLLGLIGILLLFMWFGTDHTVCANNYNLIWALPTHTILAFLNPKKDWVRFYFKGVFLLSILALAAWFILPQELNIGFIPILLLIIFRSIYLSKKNNEL